MSDRFPEALYFMGTSELELGEFKAAHANFQKLLNEFPGSEYAELALWADFRLAEAYLAGKKRKTFFGLFRVRDREEGIKVMDDITANYADTPLAEKAQKTKADYYYTRGEFELAEDEYAAFAREFPRSRFHAFALLRSAESALASFPGIKFDDAGLVEAQERYGQFLQAYPEQARENEVPARLEQIAARRADKSLDIARFYEKTKKLGAARYYYRATVVNWPQSPAASEAHARLAALGDDAPGAAEPIVPESPASAGPANSG
jgi:outer membrane protein assembly factor BamD